MLVDLIPPSKDTIWQTGLKKYPTIGCLKETNLINRNKHWLSVKSWKTIYQNIGPWKQARVTILISDKIDFKPTLIKQDKEGHSIIIKGEIHQKDITIIKLNVPKISAPNFFKHTLKDLQEHIDSNTVVVGEFNTPPSPIDRSSKQKTIKKPYI
jgi:hypothetical protein